MVWPPSPLLPLVYLTSKALVVIRGLKELISCQFLLSRYLHIEPGHSLIFGLALRRKAQTWCGYPGWFVGDQEEMGQVLEDMWLNAHKFFLKSNYVSLLLVEIVQDSQIFEISSNIKCRALMKICHQFDGSHWILLKVCPCTLVAAGYNTCDKTKTVTNWRHLQCYFSNIKIKIL